MPLESNPDKAAVLGVGRASPRFLGQSGIITRSLDRFLVGASDARKPALNESSSDMVANQNEMRTSEASTSRETQSDRISTNVEEYKPRREPLCEILSQALPFLKNSSRRSSYINPGNGKDVACSTQRFSAITIMGSALMECSPTEGDRPSLNSAPETGASLLKKARKRSLFKVPVDPEAEIAITEQCRSEMASLMKYYREDGKLDLLSCNWKINGASGGSHRAEIAVLVEESDLTFSSLVSQIFDKLQEKDCQSESNNLTLVSIRSTVLSIAERNNFGVANADADVLEDNSEACLWCWQVRDLKLLPEAQRDIIAIRRRRRRKISERLSALSAVVTALAVDQKQARNLLLSKAETALVKTDNEIAIRVAVAGWIQKINTKQMAKEAKVKEKEAVREQQRIDREKEKERNQQDKEAEKQRLLQEKEASKEQARAHKEATRQEKEKEKLEKEASKERVRAHREATRQEKDLKRQQDEADKEQKRKEKEAAELRKQAALQKQASIMDRFLQSKKGPVDSGKSYELGEKDAYRSSHCESRREEFTTNMDRELGESHDQKFEELVSFHVACWEKIRHGYTIEKAQRWGLRRLPKAGVFRELRVQGGFDNSFQEGSPGETQLRIRGISNSALKRSRHDLEDDELRGDKVDLEWEEPGCLAIHVYSSQDVRADAYRGLQLQNKRRKLLQFDKSHRPAYYGTFSQKSDVVGPRNPFKKDPTLDYENDSDEEWEEEDPGESLSDCDKDDEDDKADVEDEDENGDDFVVPDGYLSENEGVHLEDVESSDDTDGSFLEDQTKVSSGNISEPRLIEEQDLHLFEKQLKLFDGVTEQALRSNRVFVMSNMTQESFTTLSRTERFCLQALRIRVITTDISIEAPLECSQEKPGHVNQQCKRQKKLSVTLPDSALSEMVEVMLSNSYGLERTVDALSKKFPNVSRSHLKSKVREICEFVDNHWQVKQVILEQLGLRIPSTPVGVPDMPKSPAVHLKPITKFFSKRCLPPEGIAISNQSPREKEKMNSGMKCGITEAVSEGCKKAT